MSVIEVPLNDVACTGCIGRITKGIKKYHGVENVKIVPGSGKIQVNFNENIIQSEELNRHILKLTLRTFD
ncbi:MAG: heavy-metal-associated domain-containing protein [Bacillus sp. (in: Bacteria)]|nr:heavy-metal-associated domain-containing protein [Bacillus sp. (in: firmicutes)]